MKQHQIAIMENGDIQTIYTDEIAEALNGLGNVEIVRASHVEPSIRKRGTGTYWERKSQVKSALMWRADMSPLGGTILPTTRTREESLEAEINWINRRLGKIN